MALLKLVTRIECDFYIDYDFKLHLKPGSLSRLNIRKGTYIFDPENNKSIFEALCDTLKNAVKKYDTVIPWYLMTSKENNAATVKFFEENKDD